MKSILIVDDEPMTLRLMRQALEKDGFQVRTSYDGVDALEQMESDLPDVLITDIDMPRMTGKELCIKLREDMPESDLPIFVMTSLTALEHRSWAKTVSNLFFIEKPISLRKLRANLLECTTKPSQSTDEGSTA